MMARFAGTPRGKAYVDAPQWGRGQSSGRVHQSVCEAAGLIRRRSTPHVLRHTWANMVLRPDKGFRRAARSWRRLAKGGLLAQRYRKIAPADLGKAGYAAEVGISRC